jgi:protein-disulfide isomerase
MDSNQKYSQEAKEIADKMLKENRIVLFSKYTCPPCAIVKENFKKINQKIFIFTVDVDGN